MFNKSLFTTVWRVLVVWMEIPSRYGASLRMYSIDSCRQPKKPILKTGDREGLIILHNKNTECQGSNSVNVFFGGVNNIQT
jgi:hypothetical protein